MNIGSITHLSVKQLKDAIAVKERIEALEAQLASLLGEAKAVVSGKAGRRGGRRLSAEARAKIAAAARARWARVKGTSGSKASQPVRRRRKLSPAARAKIAAAARARWARERARK